MFKDMKIRTRLLLSYGLIIIITTAISISSIISFQNMAKKAEHINQFVTVPTGQLVKFSVAYGNIRTAMRDITTTIDEEETNRLKTSIETNWSQMETAFSEYEQLMKDNVDKADKDEYKAVSEISDALVTYKDSLFNKLLPLAVENKNVTANQIRIVELAPPGNIIRDNIDFLVGLNISQSDTALKETHSVQKSMMVSNISLLVLTVVFVLLLAYFIIKSITKPINQMIVASNSLAAGDLNINIDTSSKSEIGILFSNFDKMAKSISGLISDIQDMSDTIEKGDTDKRIDITNFSGSYRRVALGINDMMEHTYGEINQFLSCMAKFSDGDFSADIEKLPGKKIVMNESLDNMRSNLKTISYDINSLVKSASKGDLNKKIDESRYDGDWNTIAVGLNNFLNSIVLPIRETATVLTAISNGDLSQTVDGDYNGEFGQLKETINFTVVELRKYIKDINRVLVSLSKDNYDVSVDIYYLGEFFEIKEALNKVIERINNVINEIGMAAEQVDAGARLISEASIDLAQGSTEQASAVEELNASIFSISDQAKTTANMADSVNKRAEEAQENAIIGNNEMKNMLSAMNEIDAASGSISKIIKVIEDIAFQTNLLALNAAVEAARAGQHGRGFAVVSEQVRMLASKSQEAAKETTSLIEGTVEKVGEGTKIANQTAEALEKIVVGIADISKSVKDISLLANEQENGIEQINIGIGQIAEVAQSNTATSEEQAASAQELSSQAETFNNMVSQFTIKKIN